MELQQLSRYVRMAVPLAKLLLACRRKHSYVQNGVVCVARTRCNMFAA